ncbi:MAG: transcriptional regulator BetI [Pseudomonadota bacterium]
MTKYKSGPRPKTHAEINVYRRQALIEATVRSIHDLGYRDTTVGSICRAAGVSRGLIRHYFSSKDDLMLDTYRHLRNELHAEIQVEMSRVSTSLQKLHAMIRAMFLSSVFEEHRIAAWLALSVEAQTNARLRDVNREIYESYRQDATQLFEGAMSSQGRVQWARRAANTLIALTDGLWLEYRLDSSAFSREEAAEICIEYVEMAVSRNQNTDSDDREN